MYWPTVHLRFIMQGYGLHPQAAQVQPGGQHHSSQVTHPLSRPIRLSIFCGYDRFLVDSTDAPNAKEAKHNKMIDLYGNCILEFVVVDVLKSCPTSCYFTFRLTPM